MIHTDTDILEKGAILQINLFCICSKSTVTTILQIQPFYRYSHFGENGIEKPIDLCVQPGRKSPDTSFIVKFNYQQLPGIEHEVFYRSLTTGGIKKVKADQGFAKIENLTPGDAYDVWVVASKEGVKSEPCKLEDPIQTYPGKVKSVKTDKTSPTSQIISWNPVFGASSYLVKKKRCDGNYETIPTVDTELTLSNLDSGQAYKVYLSPPRDIHRRVIYSGNNVSLEVKYTCSDQEISKYVITAKSDSGDSQTKEEESCQTLFPNLNEGHCYTVCVQAVATNGVKSKKAHAEPIWIRPGSVKNLKSEAVTGNSERVYWDDVEGAESYSISVEEDGKSIKHDSNVPEITLTDLTLNKRFSVTVKAVNVAGSGQISKPVNFMTGMKKLKMKSYFAYISGPKLAADINLEWASDLNVTLQSLYFAALYPVQSVRVENSTRNPTTELIVRLEGSVVSPTSKYKLRFINLNEGTFKEIIKSGNIIKMSELHEGTKYQVGVTSVHETDEKLNSEEILSDPISTVAPSLFVETMSIGHEEQKFMWNKIDNVLEYVFHWRIEHRGWQQETVYQDELILENLEPGKKYEVYVTAINDSGEGDRSSTVQFDTVPPVPTDLQQQILSTQEFKISCKSCEGADGYIFKVNNKSFNSELPEYTLQSQDLVDIEVTVQSYNTAGESRLSNVLKFRQVVSLLQQKFKQVAENLLDKSAFVTPKLIKIPSGDVIGDLELQATQIKEGDTVMIIGENFTGKTACCSYFLQHVPNAKLAFYFDYEDVKALKTKLNVKAILHKYMPDLPEEEIDFVFHWMKNNSNQVVFVVDNFNLSPEFNPRNLLYKNEELPNQIFYNLLVTNRQVFPKSQVFCSTSHDSVKQFLNPTLSVKIYGFDDTGIINMKKNILGEKNDIADVPEVFQFFCANPGFCESILYMIKNNKIEADIDSFSSILVQLILENLNRYPLVQKKVKINNHLWQKINEVPKRIEAANINPEKVKKRKDRSNSQSQVATSVMESSINSGGLSFLEYGERSVVSRKSSINCDVLQDYITIAMYFAFFCKLDDFKKRLRKKSLKFGSFAKIWIMIAGLLRKETMKAAKKIFEPADIVIDEREVLNKCEIVKKFIKDNIGNILNQIYIEPQITLDWFSICNELNDEKLLQMCKTKIEILDKSTTDEVEKASEFLRRLPKKFCSNVKVKYACNDATKTLSIDNAIRENPNTDVGAKYSAKLILVKSEKSSNFSMKRLSSNYQSCTHSENLQTPPVYSEDKSNTEPIGETTENTSTILPDSEYRSLHAEGSVSQRPFNVRLPIKFINNKDSHSFQGYIKLSKVFTTSKSLPSESEKVSCTIPVFCSSLETQVTATIVQSERDKWKNIGTVQISKQQFVHCELDAGETYTIVLPSDGSARSVLFHLTCQIYPVGDSQIICEVSMDDGVETITRSPVSHQRFTMKLGETVNIAVKKSDNVIFDWKFSLDPESINISKTIKCHETVVAGQEQKSNTITCSIVNATTVISHITFDEWSEQQYFAHGKKSEIVENIPESSIWVQLVNESPRNMKVVARSLSSGHEIATTSTGSSAIINGIDPGDKYSVSIFDMSGGHYHKLISKTDIQTSKTIGKGGDIVRAGNCTLIFPEGAVKNGTKIEISNCTEGVPTLPDEYFCITPIMDFRSSQKRFDDPVICKLTLPHIIVEKPISVDVMCFEDNKWDKVCSSVLTENSAVEFKCDHFSPYTLAIIIQLPYSLIPKPISFRMHNMVYFDKNDNFVCVTCLDYESIMQKCETKLLKANFIPSSFIIPTFKLKLEETAGFFLKCLGVEPERLIGEWQTTLNRDFVEEWSHMQDFQMDKVAGKDRITLLFSRLLDDSPRPVEKKTQVSYPLDKNAITSTEPSSAAVNTIQGHHMTVITNNPVLHGN
uniref:uncharacterized protein LOC120337164 n=1 Tax=Styela clava TaxID=7725 RepID=UPI00193A52D6|nr:uncharacterized protein LOC120337164 [Styela clava]